MATKNKIGEEQIKKILTKHKEIYSTKVKLFLKYDNKKFRIPDFYLHKYDLAIEYFGSWNYSKNIVFQKKERQRFLRKIDAYNKNNVNCVFIYPSEIDSAEDIIFGAIKEIKNGNKPLAWVLPWLFEDKIDPPRAEDFKEKEEPIDWVIPWLDEKKIKPLKVEDIKKEITKEKRVAPLKWDIPWLKEEKIDPPRVEDFKEKETIEVKEKINDLKKEIVSKNTVENIISDDEASQEDTVSSDFGQNLNSENLVPIIGVILIFLILLLLFLFLVVFIFSFF